MSETDFVVIGIGADGWNGLGDTARDELRRATLIAGSPRQLDLLPELAARRHAWSSPMVDDLHAVLDAPPETPVHILASGDPMFHGVGTTIIRHVGADRVRIVPTVSSASLAAARLGWDLTDTRIVSLVTAPVTSLARDISAGVRLLILSRDAGSPEAIAAQLIRSGHGESRLTVLEQLGGADETIAHGTAGTWNRPPGDRLNIVAVECVGPASSRQSGLPDSEFDNDGQLTKTAVRALTVTALRPAPGQLLWDVGGGAGSVAIEWLRTESTCRAVVFETDPTRRERILGNAERLGVGTTITVDGEAPQALHGAPTPDAIFIGGGLCTDGMVEACWSALRPGGTIVANAVTIESETAVLHWHRTHGGELRRVHLEHAAPLGSMTTWRPVLPVTQWIATKEHS
ncbi:precorrin-6y C5,15-methyltransferase (decarboxylating) subunit CbiE [Williamsia sp.]|uniref:precorrin-6y C5,15-methyltransferase (decarboxylating) subunit CbiE n=1 Tax=Williamsia sp. TaxID=1872085 RepID=UPI001A2E0759|nr:precorrin-6y C5,15-methyltransferase (decarboxylating) subunit CbiE [Williamsia sp.]MBJ7290632.1 precorrin-6y C5,15-methyltransferase (decarboxylating) subunit CbiE [Williamsia sp.]